MTRKPDPLPTKQAAPYIGVAEQTLVNWRSLGRGPEFIKCGRAVVYDIEALDEFKRQRTRQNTQQGGFE